MFWAHFCERPLHVFDGANHSYNPRWLYRGEPHAIVPRRKVKRFRSLPHACREINARSLCFHRKYALGDILMLMPIARRLASELELDVVKLAVGHDYHQQLARWSGTGLTIISAGHAPGDYGCDLTVDLDRALEIDHWGGEASEKHRCTLYGDAMGIRVVA